MSRRYHIVPQIGEVVIAKRRGSKNIRLSINAAGQVRVGMPLWTPYEAGLLFVQKHKQWIHRQLLAHAQNQFSNGSMIGKKHRLIFINTKAKNGLAEISVAPTKITVKTDLTPAGSVIQKQISQACERALKQEADSLLPQRVETISRRHNLPYRRLKIRKLTSRWGSCSSKKELTLSYFLVQLPWRLIDYVILHELAHTIFHNHSRDFWAFMEENVPDLRDLRAQIKAYKPRVEPQ